MNGKELRQEVINLIRIGHYPWTATAKKIVELCNYSQSRNVIDSCAHVACDAVHHEGFKLLSQQKQGEYIAKRIRQLSINQSSQPKD